MRGDDFLCLDAKAVGDKSHDLLVLRKALTKGKLHSLEDLDWSDCVADTGQDRGEHISQAAHELLDKLWAVWIA